MLIMPYIITKYLAKYLNNKNELYEQHHIVVIVEVIQVPYLTSALKI